MGKSVISFFSILAQLIRICHSFMTPNELSEVEDSFVYHETEYIMLKLRVTWNEAEIVCEAYKNGSLAIVNNPQIMHFLGKALSETNLEMEDLWIGARAITPGGNKFAWINNAGTYVPDSYFIKRGPEHFEQISRDCLSFAREFHLAPKIINLECQLRRPLICEKPYEREYNGSMTTPDWITIGKFEYGIFYDRKTWRQAAQECRKGHNAHLASFRNDEEIGIIEKYLLIGRPSLENAWIGGFFKHGAWRFLHDNSAISNETNNETLFPPWRQNRTLKHTGCLLLDRHLANRSVFVEARCERRRSYICTKGFRHFMAPGLIIIFALRIPDYSVILIKNTCYFLWFQKKIWENARKSCISIGAKLLTVTKRIIHDVTYIMGENYTEIDHIWIGGKLSENGEHFQWIDTGEVIPPNNKGINHYPPWFDNVYDPDFPCLNMDRENHNRPMFYGAACDIPQMFICEQNMNQGGGVQMCLELSNNLTTTTIPTTTKKPDLSKWKWPTDEKEYIILKPFF